MGLLVLISKIFKIRINM